MQEKPDLWTRTKWPSDPARSLKVEVLDLLRTLHLLGIKSATDNKFGHMIDLNVSRFTPFKKTV